VFDHGTVLTNFPQRAAAGQRGDHLRLRIGEPEEDTRDLDFFGPQ